MYTETIHPVPVGASIKIIGFNLVSLESGTNDLKHSYMLYCKIKKIKKRHLRMHNRTFHCKLNIMTPNYRKREYELVDKKKTKQNYQLMRYKIHNNITNYCDGFSSSAKTFFDAFFSSFRDITLTVLFDIVQISLSFILNILSRPEL